jgi:hypothetical protein
MTLPILPLALATAGVVVLRYMHEKNRRKTVAAGWGPPPVDAQFRGPGPINRDVQLGGYATGQTPAGDPYTAVLDAYDRHYAESAPGFGYDGDAGPVTRDEAFAAASQLQSMYPNVRALAAQGPQGFYVRVITQGFGFGGGRGGAGPGLGQSLFDKSGRVRQPAGRGGSDWGDAMRMMNRMPSQIGRVPIVIDRLVTPDFGVGGEPSSEGPLSELTRTMKWEDSPKTDRIPFAASQNSTSKEAAQAAQDKLRDDLLARCKCVRNWIRGIALSQHQDRCKGSVPRFYLDLLVDGNTMSDEARGMIPPFVGQVPVRILDIGTDMVPVGKEIVTV